MTESTGKVNLLGLTQPQLESFFESIGEKRFRAGQVMKWIHHFGVDDFFHLGLPRGLFRFLTHFLSSSSTTSASMTSSSSEAAAPPSEAPSAPAA